MRENKRVYLLRIKKSWILMRTTGIGLRTVLGEMSLKPLISNTNVRFNYSKILLRLKQFNLIYLLISKWDALVSRHRIYPLRIFPERRNICIEEMNYKALKTQAWKLHRFHVKFSIRLWNIRTTLRKQLDKQQTNDGQYSNHKLKNSKYIHTCIFWTTKNNLRPWYL